MTAVKEKTLEVLVGQKVMKVSLRGNSEETHVKGDFIANGIWKMPLEEVTEVIYRRAEKHYDNAKVTEY